MNSQACRLGPAGNTPAFARGRRERFCHFAGIYGESDRDKNSNHSINPSTYSMSG